MKVKLLRDARVRRFAGEIVEVTPAEAAFLLSCGSAQEVKEEDEKNDESNDVKPAPKSKNGSKGRNKRI